MEVTVAGFPGTFSFFRGLQGFPEVPRMSGIPVMSFIGVGLP